MKILMFCAVGIQSVLLAACVSVTTSAVDSVDGVRQATSRDASIDEPRKRAKIHTELGSLYLQEGRFAIALEEARIALSADGSYAPAYNLLGLTHMFMSEPALAEENFDKALRAAPGDPEISNNYGWFLCQNGKEKQAIEYFMRAGSNPLYQTPAKPYTNAGICAARIGDDKAAEGYLTRALALDPRNAQALFGLADIAYRQSRLLEARQWIVDLEKLVELPADATWLALRIERKLGNRDGESRHVGQLRRKFPSSPEQRKLLQGDYE